MSDDIELSTSRELAQNYLTQLKNMIYQQGIALVEIGRQLLIFKNEKLYEHLGHENFRQFISDADIGISPSTAYGMMQIYTVYCLKLKIDEEKLADVPWSKLYALAPIVDGKAPDEAKDWLNKARSLGSGDFFDEVNEYKQNKKQKKRLPYPKIRRCKECGGWRIEPEPHTICKCVAMPQDAEIL